MHGGTFIEVVCDFDLNPITLNKLVNAYITIEDDHFLPSLPL
jgi:hypothetical protein